MMAMHFGSTHCRLCSEHAPLQLRRAGCLVSRRALLPSIAKSGNSICIISFVLNHSKTFDNLHKYLGTIHYLRHLQTNGNYFYRLNSTAITGTCISNTLVLRDWPCDQMIESHPAATPSKCMLAASVAHTYTGIHYIYIYFFMLSIIATAANFHITN